MVTIALRFGDDTINLVLNGSQHVRCFQLGVPASGERASSGGPTVAANIAFEGLKTSLITVTAIHTESILTPKRCSISSGVKTVGSGLWPLPMSYKA